MTKLPVIPTLCPKCGGNAIEVPCKFPKDCAHPDKVAIDAMRRLLNGIDRRFPGVREDKFILNGKVPEACSDLLRWGLAMERERHVAQTTIAPYWISTVFLGLDHNFGDGDPILFETMVFGDEGGGEEHFTTLRYSTWAQAEAGHAEICTRVQQAIDKAERLTEKVFEDLKR